MLTRYPCLVPRRAVMERSSLGDPLVDRYLEFVAARCRLNIGVGRRAVPSDQRVQEHARREGAVEVASVGEPATTDEAR